MVASLSLQKPSYICHLLVHITWCLTWFLNLKNDVDVYIITNRYFNKTNLYNVVRLQHLQLPQVASLWRQKVLPVLQHPGSYLQKATGMELLQDLNCSTKRKVLHGHKLQLLLTVHQLWQKLSLVLMSTQNMNFRCWPTLPRVMDQRVVHSLP